MQNFGFQVLSEKSEKSSFWLVFSQKCEKNKNDNISGHQFFFGKTYISEQVIFKIWPISAISGHIYHGQKAKMSFFQKNHLSSELNLWPDMADFSTFVEKSESSCKALSEKYILSKLCSES